MELALGLKLLVEGLPAIAQIFTALQEERLAQLKHEQAREMHKLSPNVNPDLPQEHLDIHKWRFEQEKSLQHQLAAYDRETLLKIAAYERETALRVPEMQKILNSWPLRLLPSQILESHHSERPIPLQIFISPLKVESERFLDIAQAIPEIELNLTHGLREFLSNNYPLSDRERPTEFLADSLVSKRFYKESSIKSLFAILKSEPTLILESEIVGDYLNFRIAYWGFGQKNYCYQTIVNRLPYGEILYASAKSRALQWKETANKLLECGEPLEEIRRLGGDNSINLEILEKEEKWKCHGIDISQIPLHYHINSKDFEAVSRFLIICHCLVVGWVADAHHLIHYNIPPLLPKLLANLTQDIAQNQVQEVIQTIISGYKDIFKELEIEQPLYVSELALNLAQDLASLPNKAWALEQVNYSLKLWLKQHQLPDEEANYYLESINSPLTVKDQKYLENLKECLIALEDERGIAQVCCLLSVIESMKSKMLVQTSSIAKVCDDKNIVKAHSSLPDKLHIKGKHLLESVSITHTITGHSGRASSIALSVDGNTIASGSEDNTIKLWHLRTGELLHTFTSENERVLTITISPDGKILASSNRTCDRTYIKIWRLGNAELLRTLPGHKKWIYSLAITPDGKTLVSGSHRIKIWDLSSGELLRTLTGHKKWIHALAISPDGQTLVSGSGDKTIGIWHLPTGKQLHTLTGHSDWVRTVAISADGQIIASGSDDNTIKIWDLHTGKFLHTFTGHSDWVLAVAISPDGETLISGSKDNTIKLWNLQSGQLLRTLTGHKKWVYSLAVSPDGQSFASGSEDKTIKIWRSMYS